MGFSTRQSLIARIMNGDEVGWKEFEKLYRPLLLMRGKDRGLNPEGRQDLVQDAMVSVFQARDRFVYRSEKGCFRAYLKKIADRRAFDILRKRQPQQEDYQTLEEQGVFVTSSAYEDMERRWDRVWRGTQIKEALAVVKAEVTETTWEKMGTGYLLHSQNSTNMSSAHRAPRPGPDYRSKRTSRKVLGFRVSLHTVSQ